MDWSPDAIRKLREILANLYPQNTDALRIIRDAKLDPARIATDPKAINNWFNILEYAQHHDGKIDSILGIALEEFPDLEVLKQAQNQAPPTLPRGPEVTDWRGPRAGSQLEKLMGTRSTLDT